MANTPAAGEQQPVSPNSGARVKAEAILVQQQQEQNNSGQPRVTSVEKTAFNQLDDATRGNQAPQSALTAAAKVAAYTRTEETPRTEQPIPAAAASPAAALSLVADSGGVRAERVVVQQQAPTAVETKWPAEPAVAQQIVKTVSLMWREGVGEARIRLEPENLGTITVSLRVERGSVAAVMTSDQPTVRGWMAAHERDLRASLSESGLDLDKLVVRDEAEGRRQGQPEADAERHPRQRRPARNQAFELNA